MRVNYLAFLLLGLCIGLQSMGYVLRAGIESNTFDGYHCAPIVKVSTMEKAKEQIEINQVMTGVNE